MRIEIEERGNKNYYDEFLYLISNYKKIRNNPNKKIHKLSITGYIYSIISLAFIILFLVLYLIKKDSLFLYVVGFFTFIFSFSIVYIIMIFNKIKQYRSVKGTNVFELNEDYVGVGIESKIYKLNWDEINYVIFNNYTISFIPKDINKTIITTYIKYRQEIIDLMKKYNKEELIIEN